MKFIKVFEDISAKDLKSVGGKNSSLGEMIQNLGPQGVIIPSGFAITADAYRLHLTANNLTDNIQALLNKLNKSDINQLSDVGHAIREAIKNAPLPQEISQEVRTAYKNLENRYGNNCDVAVRSSATAEDLPNASFAGQQETYLNISGADQLVSVCTKAFASLFTNRAISYRIDHDFDHLDIALSIGVQKMVRSDKASSGVMFTLDTESGFRDVIFINSSYGLGESIVSGAVNPDEFYVHKPTLKKGFKPLLKKRLGSKKTKIIYDAQTLTKMVYVDPLAAQRFSLSDEEIFELARQALVIEEHYSTLRGCWSPMDIEWAKDCLDGKLYIVQARPETVHSQNPHNTVIEEYQLAEKPEKTLIEGKSIGRKIVAGRARLIASIKEMNQLQQGEILVTNMTDPDWEPIMKVAAGIITNQGGRTCHAAIVSRELGIPAIVGTMNATETIVNGEEITLDCSSGEVGRVYKGIINFTIITTDVSAFKKPPIEIMVNIGNPDEAFKTALIPNDGVGLARLEFIINTMKIHPMAFVHPDKVTDGDDQKIIAQLTVGYTDKKQYFIDKLAQEAGTIAAAFYPKPVIIRFSDFKSNEYRTLIGGSVFEPLEENPMLGFRGASRYYNPGYQEAFALECAALKKIRDEMGLTNAIPMVPFVRTVQEAEKIQNTMLQHGLKQGENNLELYMMVEIPSNVLLIDNFARIFDGFSIGSNDLTQMVLGVDRDSTLVSALFDERNKAVMLMLEMAITGAKRNNKKIGICGQAPSDFPEVARSLVTWGINSLSLNPDSVIKTSIELTQ